MDNQNQQLQKQPQPPSTNDAKNVIRHIALIPSVGLIFIATLFIIFGGINARGIFSQNRTSTTQGSVLDVNTTFPADENNTSPACEYSYAFTVNNQEYTGNSGSVSTSSNCFFKPGRAVTVYYNPTNPSDNGLNNNNGVTGAGFFLAGVMFMALGIFIIRKVRNPMDDKATGAQIALIRNGLQELGEYWQPRNMTRAEADQVLEDIQIRLNSQKRQK